MPNGTVMKYVYNVFGQKEQEIEDEGGLNLTTSYTYDHSGNLETTTDPESIVTRYTYDALNRLFSEIQDEGGLNLITSYRYDQAGNLRFLTDANSQTTEMQYDALNRLRKEIRPMTEETAYWYDEAGNLEEKQDAKGQTTTYTYNDADQLTQISYADGKTVTFTYDRVGNLETYNDGTTSATYTYDDLGRKLTETVNYGPFSKTFSYTYYPNDLKNSFTMPDGTTYSYAYDDNDNVTRISILGLGDIEYPSYTLHRPDSVTFPGGSSQSYTYDTLMRLERITAPEIDYQYTAYDGVSNILTKTTEHGSYTYGYDDVSRLLTADNPVLDDEALTYDGVGNRETASGITGSITHNANNELTIYGDISYDYDANGNLVSKTSASESWAYTYNVQNRLVQVEEDDLPIAEYGYDPFGRRLWKEVDGVKTYFLYADEGLVAEYDASGVEIRSYGYKPDSTWTTDPLWLKEGGSYYWYQNDHLGTPQKLVDSVGTVVWSAQYTAFGKADIQVETVTNNLRFPGQYCDAETGLYYNWFRYYDLKIGRYLQVDPNTLRVGDDNFYEYSQNNPLKWIDPWGLSAQDVSKIVVMLHTYVNQAIQEGRKHPNPFWNNFLSWFGKYKACGGQRDEVVRIIIDQNKPLECDESPELDICQEGFDEHWSAVGCYGYFFAFPVFPHEWAYLYSDNPKDPIIIIDPWWDATTVLYAPKEDISFCSQGIIGQNFTSRLREFQEESWK